MKRKTKRNSASRSSKLRVRQAKKLAGILITISGLFNSISGLIAAVRKLFAAFNW